MTSLDDRTIDAMGEDELKAALKSLRTRYRDMHRRAQVAPPEKERAEYIGKAQRAYALVELWKNSWLSEFKRLRRNHDAVKEIYEAAAKKIGLPYGRYHSVSDLPFGKASDGRLYANIHLTTVGPIETIDVAEAVKKAINA